MKSRRVLCWLLIVSMVLTVPGLSALGALVPTEWAVPEVLDAKVSGILTPRAAADFHRELTRGEFCEIVVKMAERVLGRELTLPNTNPFTDTNNIDVQKATQYGIVNGMGDNKFEPNLTVERQQLVTMMVRAITKLESDLEKTFLSPGVTTLPFSDRNAIASYAQDAMKKAYANGIIKGDDTNRVNPVSGITSQECVSVAIRSLNSMMDVISKSATDATLLDLSYEKLHIGYAYGDSENGVTQDLTLTDKGLGDIKVTWKSSNTVAINDKGVVTVGTGGDTVMLTATLTLGKNTRTKVFTVKTSPHSGDRLIVENAYNELEITYTNGDVYDRVKSRILLPDTVNGADVVWSSSNVSVISQRGAVKTPGVNEITSVTMTATISKGTQTRVKSFLLTVRQGSGSASLHGVEIGVNQTQVTTALGTPKRTITTATGEVWMLYHSNYANFIAVGMISNKVAAVYSMASNSLSQLKDAASNTVMTPEQVSALSGLYAREYRDINNSDKLYALLLYNTSTSLQKIRSLTSDGQEQLMFELVNAFRVQSGRSALSFNSKLSASARAHSVDMGKYNYLDHLSRNGNTFGDRAALEGYDRTLASAENIAAGSADAFGFLDSWVNSSAHRANILSASYTVIGLGFSGGNTGTYTTYFTQVFGTLRAITGASAKTAISLQIGTTQPVSLTVTPTGTNAYNETFNVSSSNTTVFSVVSGGNTLTPSVRGNAAGSANLVVTGTSSGASFMIPVTVGTVYATGITVSQTNVILGPGETLALTAVTTPTAGVPVSWQIISDSATGTKVNAATGVVTAGNNAGTATVRASAQSGAATYTTKDVTITVLKASFSTTDETNITTLNMPWGSAPCTLTATPNPAQNVAGTWSVSDSSIATVSATGDVTPIAPGLTQLLYTMTRAGSTGTVVQALPVRVTVADFVTDFTLSTDSVTLERGASDTVSVVATMPVSVTYSTVKWSSSNSSIATVDQNGKITAVAVGVCTIAAIMEGEFAPIARDVLVTVTPATVWPSKIEITGAKASVQAGTALQLTAKITPNNTTNQTVIWESSNANIATVDANGLVTFIAVTSTEPVTITATIMGQTDYLYAYASFVVTPATP